jgi:NhaP-type Na+/H+ and K+/H+ antiporter
VIDPDKLPARASQAAVESYLKGHAVIQVAVPDAIAAFIEALLADEHLIERAAHTYEVEREELGDPFAAMRAALTAVCQEGQ